MAPQPEDLLRTPTSGPDVRASETLVESYAEASEQLSSALNDLREERDQTRRRLEDLQKTLEAAQDILSGKPLQLCLDSVLQRMADVVGVAQAAFLLPQSGRPPVVAVLLGLTEEPLLRVAAAWRQVAETAGTQPRLHAVTDSPELVQALERGEEAFTAVLAVPFRTPHALQAVATLYFPGDAALPSAERTAHLGVMSRALSAALELASTLETVRGNERALDLALAGTASLRGLEDVVTELVTLRDGVGEMRRRADAPAWLQAEIARLAPSLQNALSATRSLLAFSRGQIQSEPLLIEDLLSELSSEQVSVRIAPGAETVVGDPALLRVALRSLLDDVRRPGSSGRSVEVRAEAAGGRVLISVAATGAGTRPAGSGPGVSLARRVAELHGGSLAGTPAGVLILSLPPG